jgi:putative ribosome biogenesis GTPase RsgA
MISIIFETVAVVPNDYVIVVAAKKEQNLEQDGVDRYLIFQKKTNVIP